jgi:hypothetical protein
MSRRRAGVQPRRRSCPPPESGSQCDPHVRDHDRAPRPSGSSSGPYRGFPTPAFRPRARLQARRATAGAQTRAGPPQRRPHRRRPQGPGRSASGWSPSKRPVEPVARQRQRHDVGRGESAARGASHARNKVKASAGPSRRGWPSSVSTIPRCQLNIRLVAPQHTAKHEEEGDVLSRSAPPSREPIDTPVPGRAARWSVAGNGRKPASRLASARWSRDGPFTHDARERATRRSRTLNG